MRYLLDARLVVWLLLGDRAVSRCAGAVNRS